MTSVVALASQKWENRTDWPLGIEACLTQGLFSERLYSASCSGLMNLDANLGESACHEEVCDAKAIRRDQRRTQELDVRGIRRIMALSVCVPGPDPARRCRTYGVAQMGTRTVRRQLKLRCQPQHHRHDTRGRHSDWALQGKSLDRSGGEVDLHAAGSHPHSAPRYRSPRKFRRSTGSATLVRRRVWKYKGSPDRLTP